MYRKIAAALAVFIGFSICAYASGGNLERSYIEKEGGFSYKFGFTDTAGNVKIPYIYDYAEPFSCGYALVRRGDRLFFIDEHGRPAFGSDKSGYEFYHSFRDGLCAVKKDGQYGYIDTSGKLVIGLAFDGAADFSEGMAAVEKDGKTGYIDKSGKAVIECAYDTADTFLDNLARVSKDGRFGFIDKTGKTMVPLMYESASEFAGGLARVRLGGKYTYTDKNGFLYFPPVFENASDFDSSGTALVKINGKYGFIKTDRSFSIAPRFDYLEKFDGEYAVAGMYVDDGVLWYGLIDRHGNRVCPFSYDKIAYGSGVYTLTKNDRTIFLDGRLEPVLER